MAFKKGQGGRPKGVKNKSTVAAKEAFTLAFERIGGVNDLAKWGKENRDEFYKLYARLIPTEHSGEVGVTVVLGQLGRA